MLNLYCFNDNLEKLKRKGKVVFLAGMIGCSVLLSGCSSSDTVANSTVIYDVLDTTNKESLQEGVTQILDVPGQDFKLVVSYYCSLSEEERWTITSTKKIDIEVRTDGLTEGKEVYIDNVHTDTIICSHFPSVEGITQDSMDDRIHNSLMLGFPIADDNFYYGTNQIEGQNDTFIKGSFYGFNSYSSGTIKEERYEESDYLERGVYANKISSVFDLIIVDKNKNKTSCISVDSDIQVSVWPFIKVNGQDSYKYFKYNEKHNTVETIIIDENKFLEMTQMDSSKKLNK